MFSCAWCGKEIPDDVPRFAIGAKARDRKWLKGREGTMIEVALVLAGKTVSAGVAGRGSQARREGHDLGFMVCSRECGADLRAALQKEARLFQEILEP